jgi:predicted amidophosphoribosyltransferase
VFRQLWYHGLACISTCSCPCCGAGHEQPKGSRQALCTPCLESLALPQGGIQGDEPLLWCVAAPYGGALRALLLRQRPRPQPRLIRGLAACLQLCCSEVLPGALLVPIPSWKRTGNPLPLLLAEGLAQASAGQAQLAPQLLCRTRPTVGQHHLGRALRSRNLLDAFAATAAARAMGCQAPVWLVDDILTTGSTALAAAQALQRAGYAVQGLLALARTPARFPAVI